MAGPYSSVRYGGHRETEAPISRTELHHFENSFLEAMERMFDKRFPTQLGHHAPQQHSPTTTYGGMLGRSGQHGGGARGHSPRHVCSMVLKMLPPKEKFSERVRNN
jgi:hypothetical protein